ncbi:TatD family deoxyribonuclease [Candidatus Parcubacteria bacterium]|nr:MAG: TatD family deoxyribonuclease [Candidatus Parcubacteria bacterium]
MSNIPYLDAHTHVQFAAFRDDWERVIARAEEENVWIVNVGTQRETSRRAVAIAEHYPKGVYAAVGLHPIHTEKSYHDVKELGADEEGKAFTSRGEEWDRAFYRELALHFKVVAIGECGFDFYRQGTHTKEKQEAAFLGQIELAREVRKPLMIHCRQAYPALLAVLHAEKAQLNDPPGIVHFFSGSREEARQLAEMGFYFTFGGVLTFTNDYDDVVRYLPLDRILSETDAPYVAPVPYRGKRNEPSYVRHVVVRLAELRGISAEEMRQRIWENAQRVFRLRD